MLWSQKTHKNKTENSLERPAIRLDSARVFVRPPYTDDWLDWAGIREGLARNYLKIDSKWQDHILFGLNV